MRPDPRPNRFSYLASGAFSQILIENAELRRQLAVKKDNGDGGDGEPNPDDEDNVGDVPGEESDIDGPNAPKKGKKKSKDTPNTDDEDEDPARPTEDKPEGRNFDLAAASDAEYWRSVRATSEAIILAGQRARAIEPPAKYRASDDQVLLTEIQVGYHPSPERIAAQICACARLARGQVVPPLPPRGSPARAILEAAAKARGMKLED